MRPDDPGQTGFYTASFFFGHTFANTPLTSLPEGSFNISNLSGATGYGFFKSTFNNTSLTSLPA
jgi:hypothetical protein